MSSSTLSRSVRDFASSQRTRPFSDFFPDWKPRAKHSFPYHEYIYPMVAGLLLSGRVRSVQKDGLPNKTDIIRWCKASNFNPYLCEWVGNFLVRGGIIKRTFDGFVRGPQIDAIETHDAKAAKKAFLTAFHDVLDSKTPRGVHRYTYPYSGGFEGYLRAFACAFRGLALAEDTLGETLLAFSELPRQNLEKAAGELATTLGDRVAGSYWFDTPGQKAFISALSSVGGLSHVDDNDKRSWAYLTDDLYVILGLKSAKAKEAIAKEFVVQSDLTVVAGCHHPLDTLAMLCRFGTIASKGQTLTFKLDAKTIKESAHDKEAMTAFRKLLESHQAKLPSTVDSLLSSGKAGGELGKLQIRGCRALIKPATPELLTAIREHRRLKGYLMADSPPGYLLIKENSDPFNFSKRCREGGFDVEFL